MNRMKSIKCIIMCVCIIFLAAPSVFAQWWWWSRTPIPTQAPQVTPEPTSAGGGSYGVTELDSDTARLWIIDASRSWADVHYRVNYGVQLNYRMNKSGSTFYWDVNNLNNGDRIDYAFTVGDPAYDTPWYVHTFGGGGSTSAPTPTPVTTQTPGGSTPAPTPAPTATPGGGQNPVFSNEGDLSGFSTMEGDGSNYPCGAGWGNNELQYYRSQNASSSNGALVITAKRENYGGYSYTSWRGCTNGSWRYGTIEARIRMENGQGYWQAFWMLGSGWWNNVNWPDCGEIDIMEHINTQNTVHGTIHWDYNGYATYSGSTGCSITSYHTYKIVWNSSAIKWYVDDVLFHEANIQNNINGTDEFNNNYFRIILNFAIGGNWPGNPNSSTPFPSYMYVDYVRVYQ